MKFKSVQINMKHVSYNSKNNYLSSAVNISLESVYIEDIYFFGVNTKYISSSVLKTSEFS